MVGAEVERQDVVAEARDVLQLSEVALQGAAGQTGLVKRSHEAEDEGVQAGGPARQRTRLFKVDSSVCDGLKTLKTFKKKPKLTCCQRRSWLIPVDVRADSGTL